LAEGLGLSIEEIHDYTRIPNDLDID
jgi:hypothetical protein